MEFLFLGAGLVLVIASARGNAQKLFEQLQQDLPGFLPFAGGFFVVALFGYIPGALPFSRAFLLLMTLSLILSNRGAIAGFTEAFGIGGFKELKL